MKNYSKDDIVNELTKMGGNQEFASISWGLAEDFHQMRTRMVKRAKALEMPVALYMIEMSLLLMGKDAIPYPAK